MSAGAVETARCYEGSVKFSEELIDTAEYQRLRARYEPLAQSVRALIDACIRTEADQDEVDRARRTIDEVTALLTERQIDGTHGVRFMPDGQGVTWGNPVIGVRNPIAPPVEIHRGAGGRVWTEFVLGAPYEGPPGHVHGGMSALILDHLLGEAASDGLTKPNFTGTISCRYLRGTPLGALRAEAFIERVDGVKTYARGHIADADGPTVQAEGVFITPAWAREES